MLLPVLIHVSLSPSIARSLTWLLYTWLCLLCSNTSSGSITTNAINIYTDIIELNKLTAVEYLFCNNKQWLNFFYEAWLSAHVEWGQALNVQVCGNERKTNNRFRCMMTFITTHFPRLCSVSIWIEFKFWSHLFLTLIIYSYFNAVDSKNSEGQKTAQTKKISCRVYIVY